MLLEGSYFSEPVRLRVITSVRCWMGFFFFLIRSAIRCFGLGHGFPSDLVFLRHRQYQPSLRLAGLALATWAEVFLLGLSPEQVLWGWIRLPLLGLLPGSSLQLASPEELLSTKWAFGFEAIFFFRMISRSYGLCALFQSRPCI